MTRESRDPLDALGHAVREGATTVVRAQWAELGFEASAERAVSVVDPEALVLSSLGLLDHDRSLVEPLTWWAGEGARLLSVQRMRNLSAAYPGSVRHRLGEFAGYARDVGGDHRWKSLVGGRGQVPVEPVDRRIRVGGAGAVLLRLRLGLGVGIKADLVAVLLGLGGWRTVRVLSDATGYSARAVRRSADELAFGGWVGLSPGSPSEYRAMPERWLPPLDLAVPAPWRHWRVRFAFLLAVDAWLRGEAWRDASPASVERAARRLVDGHRSAFKWSNVALPSTTPTSGGYLPSFRESVRELVRGLVAAV